MNLTLLFTLNKKNYMMEVPESCERFFETRMYTLMKMCDFLCYDGVIRKTRMSYMETNFHFNNLIKFKNENSDEIKKIDFGIFEQQDLLRKTYKECLEIFEAL